MGGPLLNYSLFASPFTGSGSDGPRKLGLLIAGPKSSAEPAVFCEAIMIAMPIGTGEHDLTDHPETIRMSQAGSREPVHGGGWLPRAQMNAASTFMIYTWKPLFRVGCFDGSWELYLELGRIEVNSDASAVEIFVAEDTTVASSGENTTYKLVRADLRTGVFQPSDTSAAFRPLL